MDRKVRAQRKPEDPRPSSESLGNCHPTELAVRIKRPDGSRFLLLVPLDHLDRVMALAEGEFGDKNIEL